MPTYTYQCPHGHVTELVMGMGDDHPESVRCALSSPEVDRRDDGGCPEPCFCDCSVERPECGQRAARVFHAPVAVHWSGAGGSYHEDVYRNEGGRYGWKRRKNAGDDLPMPVEAGV